jgi:hypothetical protein
VPQILPEVCRRYNIWALGNQEEPDPAKVVAMYEAFRQAVPDQRLIGPSYWEAVEPTYYDLVIPAIQNCHILSWHEYAGCRDLAHADWPWPDNSTAPWDKLNRFPDHPDLALNLAGRIKRLLTYTKHLRVDKTSPDLIADEYGLDAGNEANAYAAAKVFRQLKVPVCLWTPHARRPNQAGDGEMPWGNGLYASPDAHAAGTWARPMQVFLEAMNER